MARIANGLPGQREERPAAALPPMEDANSRGRIWRAYLRDYARQEPEMRGPVVSGDRFRPRLEAPPLVTCPAAAHGRTYPADGDARLRSPDLRDRVVCVFGSPGCSGASVPSSGTRRTWSRLRDRRVRSRHASSCLRSAVLRRPALCRV